MKDLHAGRNLHTCPGSDRDSTHSAQVDYAELLPSLFELQARDFYIALADEPDRTRVLKIIRQYLKPGHRIFVGVISPMRLIPRDRQDEEREILSRIRRGERLDHFETIRLAKDGRSLNVSLTVSPIKDFGGHVVGASKVARDITQRKVAEQDAERADRERQRLLESEREARLEAEQANRVKDEFLATLSHELRTPLNAVLGWANILRLGKLQGEERKQAIDIIERNARVQAQIIEDLLDMSRIISGKVRLDVQRIELSAVLNAAIETLRATADSKGVHLQVLADPLVEPISGDSNRLQQVSGTCFTMQSNLLLKTGTFRLCSNAPIRMC
jgi:signal transduction histidine kinase